MAKLQNSKTYAAPDRRPGNAVRRAPTAMDSENRHYTCTPFFPPIIALPFYEPVKGPRQQPAAEVPPAQKLTNKKTRPEDSEKKIKAETDFKITYAKNKSQSVRTNPAGPPPQLPLLPYWGIFFMLANHGAPGFFIYEPLPYEISSFFYLEASGLKNFQKF